MMWLAECACQLGNLADGCAVPMQSRMSRRAVSESFFTEDKKKKATTAHFPLTAKNGGGNQTS